MIKENEYGLRRWFFSLGLVIFLGVIVVILAVAHPKISLNISTNSPQPGYYRVTSVSDGDTIVVDMDGRQEPVRFIGVDTPETHKPNTPVQCWGPEATDYTRNILAKNDNQVRLEADPDNTNRDRYDRLLRYVYLKDGTLINLKLIGEGQGFAYTGFPFSKTSQFKEAGEQAKQQKLGLWLKCPVITNQYGGYETTPAD